MAESEARDVIDEEPMTLREIEHHLEPLVSRKDRRRFLWVLRQANLIVFHAD